MTTAPAEQPRATSPASYDEIDLRQVARALRRRWRWIAGGGTIGILLSSVNLLTTKPVYQGEFQIVLDQSNSQSGAAGIFSQNPAFTAIARLSGGGGDDSIATEVQILNSPSVLRPVFDAVKARKPPEVAKSMRFQNWAKSAITAEEEKGTSVLNVEFRDTDKQLVLPITEMISDAYQGYSNRGRARELSNLITYLNEQINTIKPQAEASARAALDYGYSHNLGLLDGLPFPAMAGAGMSKDGAVMVPSGRQRRKHRSRPHRRPAEGESARGANQASHQGRCRFALLRLPACLTHRQVVDLRPAHLCRNPSSRTAVPLQRQRPSGSEAPARTQNTGELYQRANDRPA